jgi:hypothetical protein
MDKATLKKLCERLTQLASDIDDAVHDDEQPTLYVCQVGEYEDNVGDWQTIYEVDSDRYEGKLSVVGYDSVETLAGWLGTNIERGIAR